MAGFNYIERSGRLSMNKRKFKTNELTFIALSAAVICILGPVAVSVGPVPVSLTNLVVFFSVYVIGTWKGTASYCVYLLLGAVGLPVFSGFTGGLAKLAGPTGGYLIGFIPMAIIGGLVLEKARRNFWITLSGWCAAIAVGYLFGTIWFIYVTGYTFWQALTVCVFPFLIWDFFKLVTAILLGKRVRAALLSAGVIK